MIVNLAPWRNRQLIDGPYHPRSVRYILAACLPGWRIAVRGADPECWDATILPVEEHAAEAAYNKLMDGRTMAECYLIPETLL